MTEVVEGGTNYISFLVADGSDSNFTLTGSNDGTNGVMTVTSDYAANYFKGITADSTDATSVATVATVNAHHAKDSAVVSSTTDVDIATTALDAGQTFDSRTLVAGDRVLLTGQTDSSENGLWEVQGAGVAQRPADFNADAEVPGATFRVVGGANAGKHYYVASPVVGDAFTLGTTAITVTEFSGGSGLSESLTPAYVYVGNSGGTATGVEITGDIDIDDTGLVSIAPGVIVNADIDASADIAPSKIALETLTVGTGLDGNAASYNAQTAATISIASAQTAIETMYNTSLKLGTAGDQEYIDFASTANEILLKCNDTTQLRVTDEGGTGKTYIRGTYQVFSDERIKQVVGVIEDPIARIMELDGCTYRLIRRDGTPGDRVEMGMLAGQTEAVVPEVVSEVDAEGYSDLKTINYSGITALNVSGLKNHELRIRELEARLAALEARL